MCDLLKRLLVQFVASEVRVGGISYVSLLKHLLYLEEERERRERGRERGGERRKRKRREWEGKKMKPDNTPNLQLVNGHTHTQ